MPSGACRRAWRAGIAPHPEPVNRILAGFPLPRCRSLKPQARI
ncbi:MAG: hypothetical protein OJF58_001617 [Enhydrobacter sp.]|nr:MAG: hypothetical protein OJF58_001617 [Enhydrobacter sp.]